MRIGLILPAVPAYSETFFRNKIRFLMETPGVEVVLFADRFSKHETFDLCPVVYPIQFSSNAVWSMLERIGFTLTTILKHPVRTFALWKLNYRSGFPVKRNLASLLSSAHLFSSRLDWLHFGFGTMAIGRENLARVVGAKLAVSFRGFDIAIYPLKHKNCYTLLWNKVDKVHVISDDLKKLVYAAGYSPVKALEKITPAIDTSRFMPAHPERSSVTHLVTTARLHWKKGLEYTLEALAMLKDSGVAFHYSIIGEGEERERLMFAVYQFGLTDRVTFCGRLSHVETIEKLAKADIYIQYSIQEGFCNAVLEAQAMGLLCVVSDAEGLSENVVHEKTGWVVPKRKPALLAARLLEVMRLDEKMQQAVRAQARERVRAEFNLERQKDEFYLFYTQVQR
jgi:colanic acid/amylovoran biosynthesis glycosyltransferase